MAQTQAIVHYATASGILRRIVFPDDDSLLAHTQAMNPPGTGESQTTFTIAPNAIQAAANRVKIVTAKAVLPTGRCVVVGPLSPVTSLDALDGVFAGGIDGGTNNVDDPAPQSGTVLDVFYADLAIDDVSSYTSRGFTVVASDVAGVGWTWSAVGGFVEPPAFGSRNFGAGSFG